MEVFGSKHRKYLIDEYERRSGKVYLIPDRCKGCRLCQIFCPTGVLHESKEFNAKGYHPPVMIEEPPDKVCIQCGFCGYICPEFAIYTYPPEKSQKGEDVHET